MTLESTKEPHYNIIKTKTKHFTVSLKMTNLAESCRHKKKSQVS